MAYVAQHAFHHLEEHLELTAVEFDSQMFQGTLKKDRDGLDIQRNAYASARTNILIQYIHRHEIVEARAFLLARRLSACENFVRTFT